MPKAFRKEIAGLIVNPGDVRSTELHATAIEDCGYVGQAVALKLLGNRILDEQLVDSAVAARKPVDAVLKYS